MEQQPAKVDRMAWYTGIPGIPADWGKPPQARPSATAWLSPRALVERAERRAEERAAEIAAGYPSRRIA